MELTNSQRLAGLIGPTLMALTISEALTSEIWLTVTATQTYLAGTLWFIAGLSIIRTHNIWKFDWTVLVTMIGWFAFLGGLARMFFPQATQDGEKNNLILLIFQIVLLVIGIILTFVAYFRKK